MQTKISNLEQRLKEKFLSEHKKDQDDKSGTKDSVHLSSVLIKLAQSEKWKLDYEVRLAAME